MVAVTLGQVVPIVGAGLIAALATADYVRIRRAVKARKQATRDRAVLATQRHHGD